jgi:hypothetical protein
MKAVRWVLDSPERLKYCASALAVTVVLLAITLTINRLPEATSGPLPTASAEPAPTDTRFLPDTPAPDSGSPLPDYGPSDQVALEAVAAFLRNDSPGFARLAQQEATETVNEAPARPAGARITGDVVLVLGGPTRQTVDVPTTDGPLRLDMVVVDGSWKVLDIEYAR